MEIVGVAACTAGIAHAYIAQEKLENAAKKAGHEMHIETRGTIGIENELTPKQIKEADLMILAIGVKISDRERFEGKRIIQVPTEIVIRSPNKLIEKGIEVVKQAWRNRNAMEVTSIIDPNTIKTNLAGTTREEVLEELVIILLENAYITDTKKFMKDIYAREEEGQTGIRDYIVIPHGKSTSVKKIGIAIGVTVQEILWETLDGKGVKGIILFAVGNDNDGAKTHLKLLSLFARKLGNDEVIEQLIEAKETKEVIAAFAS